MTLKLNKLHLFRSAFELYFPYFPFFSAVCIFQRAAQQCEEILTHLKSATVQRKTPPHLPLHTGTMSICFHFSVLQPPCEQAQTFCSTMGHQHSQLHTR